MDQPTLTQRLDRLERELRRWKILGSAAVAVLALVVLMGAKGAKVPDEIRAKRFVLVDEIGKQRAVLGSGEVPHQVLPSLPGKKPFATGLTLFDTEKKLRAGLYMTADDDSWFIAYDKNEQSLARFGVSKYGTAALYLAGQDAIDRAWLEVSGNAPTLVFRDELTRQRVVLGGFTLWLGPGGKIDVARGVGENRPTSSMVLIDGDGKVIWQAP